jgi:hypothetical protein
VLNLSRSSDLVYGGRDGKGCGGIQGDTTKLLFFLDYFKDLPDPRRLGKVTYPLGEVLLLCLLAVLGDAETFVDIVRFGEK